MAHFHGLVLPAAFHVAVLQGGDLIQNGIEHFSALVDEDEIVHIGYVLHLFPTLTAADFLLHGNEEFVL